MFVKTYTVQEIEASAYLKSVGVPVPYPFHIEPFERIHHELFKIYPDLLYLYNWHKFGSDYAGSVYDKNMLSVSDVYNRRIANTTESFTLLRQRAEYNPFGDEDFPNPN